MFFVLDRKHSILRRSKRLTPDVFGFFLQASTASAVTEPRDRVYGLLGIYHLGPQDGID